MTTPLWHDAPRRVGPFSPRRVVFFMLLALVVAGCGGGGNGEEGKGNGSDKVPDDDKIEMVLIPAGHFNMGSRTGQDDEKPVHKVWIDAFMMDRTEVTQAAFERIAKEIPLPNPAHFKGGNRPVEQVKWPDVIQFCNARSKLEKLELCYDDEGNCDFSKNGYRLPTEAEWEYACRAGTETDYSFGNSERELGDHAWFNMNSAKTTHPVAQKKPNPWGLYDMHGNVAEWCHDVYAKNYYTVQEVKNPRGPEPSAEGGDLYVVRGGSWQSLAPTLRSAYRLGQTAGFNDACLAKDAIGFRCVRKAP